MGMSKSYLNKFLKSGPPPHHRIDQLVPKSRPAPAFLPGRWPFPGALLPLLPSPGMAWGHFGHEEVVGEVICPFPWFVPLPGRSPGRRRRVSPPRRLPRRISTFGPLRELRGGRLFTLGAQYKNSPLGS
jgi:hypothetical protein